MNRRGFFGVLVGAAAAPRMPTPKPQAKIVGWNSDMTMALQESSDGETWTPVKVPFSPVNYPSAHPGGAHEK